VKFVPDKLLIEIVRVSLLSTFVSAVGVMVNVLVSPALPSKFIVLFLTAV